MISSCTIQKASFPVGIFPKQTLKIPGPDPAAAVVPDGYTVEVFMKDLTWPSSVEFDQAGKVYIAEAGYVYGDPFAPAQILRITPAGEGSRYATGLGTPAITREGAKESRPPANLSAMRRKTFSKEGR